MDTEHFYLVEVFVPGHEPVWHPLQGGLEPARYTLPGAMLEADNVMTRHGRLARIVKCVLTREIVEITIKGGQRACYNAAVKLSEPEQS